MRGTLALTQWPQRASRQCFSDSDLVFTDDRAPVEFMADSLVLRLANRLFVVLLASSGFSPSLLPHNAPHLLMCDLEIIL